MATNENLPPNVIKQLAKELKNLDETPPEGIKVAVNDDNFSTIFADIDGPAGTPYDNGMFRMKLLLSHDFPRTPPKGFFVTKIFHPNVATNGEICVNTLKKDWNPSLGLRHVLLVVRCLLIEPFPESALNEQAGKLLLEDYEEYARIARMYTNIHALRPKLNPKGLVDSDSTMSTPNVEETKTVSGAMKSLSVNPLASSKPSSMSSGGTKSHDHNQPSVSKEPPTRPDASVVSTPQTKKAPVVGTKGQVDKRKVDARKKSLRRL